MNRSNPRLAGLRPAILFFVVMLAALSTRSSRAQSAMPALSEQPTTVTLGLDEAIQIALVKSYVLRNAHLDVDEASALIGEGWGQLMPQIDVNSTYTRNIRSANPFAGSEAGGLFTTLGFIDWLAFNEGARTDGNDNTAPITLEEFFLRREAGLAAAGGNTSSSDNPFAIPNQVRASVSVDQKIFDIRAFWGVSGARKYLKDRNEAGLRRQEQLVVDDVRRAFYGALLASENVRVVELSVSRTRATRDETAQRVAQGVLPKYQRLSAEVELANLESGLIRSKSDAAAARDQLKMVLGMPVHQAVQLRGVLDPDQSTFMTVAVNDAVESALRQRADLEQARLNIELQRVQEKVAKAEYFPTINAFADFGYTGSVPENRTSFFSNPNDPFSFSSRSNAIFSDPYWDFTVSAGLSMTWNIFNGFQSRARWQQRRIATDRARIAYDQLEESVQLEVQAALRNMEATQLQIASQSKNVERAELNYQYASARLGEGVASSLEERQASDLLDQSQLSYLQAVHDFLVARSALDTAMGATPGAVARPNFTVRE